MSVSQVKNRLLTEQYGPAWSAVQDVPWDCVLWSKGCPLRSRVRVARVRTAPASVREGGGAHHIQKHRVDGVGECKVGAQEGVGVSM